MENCPLMQREKETPMKKLLLSAVALTALMAAPIASAQDQNSDQPKKHDTATPDRGDAMKGPGDNAMKGPGPGDNSMRGPGNNDNGGMRGNGNNNNNNNAMRGNGNNNDRDKTVNKTVNKTVVHKTVDRTVVLKARANLTAPKRFHISVAYARPAGWYAHRWTYGERLPRAFFASEYFITDFATYGLMAPWDGYEWVRYGDDALLIDTDTGEVIRTEYDLFD
jgi:Ni/Co efflux regulator RcnB